MQCRDHTDITLSHDPELGGGSASIADAFPINSELEDDSEIHAMEAATGWRWPCPH
jgi:hypothetical protein